MARVHAGEGAFIRAKQNLYEYLTGEWDADRGAWRGNGQAQRIGIGHIVYHPCIERVRKLLDSGMQRGKDGGMEPGPNASIEIVTDEAVIVRYVEACLAGRNPSPADQRQGATARAPMQLSHLDAAVQAVYVKARKGKPAPVEQAAAEPEDTETAPTPAAKPAPKAKVKKAKPAAAAE